MSENSLCLGYQALEFSYFSLINPGGVGLQTAQDFESEADQYLPILEEISVTLEKARKQLKDIEFLREKFAAMTQGFYLEREDSVEIEGVEQKVYSEEELLELSLNTKVEEPLAEEPTDTVEQPVQTEPELVITPNV